jgi:hypothetical protein
MEKTRCHPFEHILISTILDSAWKQGQSLDLPALIQQIQNPSVTRIGVLGLDCFFPAKERFGLAMALNNLLAALGFDAWLQRVVERKNHQLNARGLSLPNRGEGTRPSEMALSPRRLVPSTLWQKTVLCCSTFARNFRLGRQPSFSTGSSLF